MKKYLLGIMMAVIVGTASMSMGNKVARAATFKASVTAESLNVRPTPTMKNKPLGVVHRGEVVTVHQVLPTGWVKIDHGRYVYKTYLDMDNSTQGNAVSTNNAQTTGSGKYNDINLSSSDRELLARLVRAEAGGEGFQGQVAVAQVVFNRMKDQRFPNTLSGVVYQKKQFSPVANGSINKTAHQTNYDAVDYALRNGDVTQNALYFYAPSLVRSPYMESLRHLTVIGVHHFKTDRW